MKLYLVPRNTYIRVEELGDNSPIYLFHNIDGMYSYCTDEDGNVVHLMANTDVTILGIE